MSQSEAPVEAAPSGEHRAGAIVYCEANFGAIDGKTANGLVRHSERFRILSVIDSRLAGLDAGTVLGEEPNGIPIHRDLDEALSEVGASAELLIVGVAPTSGLLSVAERGVFLAAMRSGLSIVNGLHEFFGDDPEFTAAAARHGVQITDVRRPRDKVDLRMFTGSILEVSCPRIAVLGTDGAIGKRTTATILTAALLAHGIRAVLVGTGQTSLIQGARHGVALDAVPAQFVTGELEGAVVEAFRADHPDVIIVEGQGALSHPTYLSSTAILRGSRPEAVILQHAPTRRTISDFPAFPMPTAASEIALIEAFADTRVIGMTLNHEGMVDSEISAAITAYELELGIPVTDALARPTSHLVEMVVGALPELGRDVSIAVG